MLLLKKPESQVFFNPCPGIIKNISVTGYYNPAHQTKRLSAKGKTIAENPKPPPPEPVEFFCSPFNYGKLRSYIYGISVFDTKDTDVVRILSEHNDGEIDDSEDDSFGFLETSIRI